MEFTVFCIVYSVSYAVNIELTSARRQKYGFQYFYGATAAATIPSSDLEPSVEFFFRDVWY